MQVQLASQISSNMTDRSSWVHSGHRLILSLDVCQCVLRYDYMLTMRQACYDRSQGQHLIATAPCEEHTNTIYLWSKKSLSVSICALSGRYSELLICYRYLACQRSTSEQSHRGKTLRDLNIRRILIGYSQTWIVLALILAMFIGIAMPTLRSVSAHTCLHTSERLESPFCTGIRHLRLRPCRNCPLECSSLGQMNCYCTSNRTSRDMGPPLHSVSLPSSMSVAT